MLEHKKIGNLNDFFTDLTLRRSQEVYFYRINGYSEEIGAFIQKYYEVARRTGVVIEGKIQNPDEKNLSYYNEVMGTNFQLNQDFIYVSLRKWIPRMDELQSRNLATSIYQFLRDLKYAGKTENMLKNAYIKFMCWLYYKFERIVNQLGANNIPKILYEGSISNYELMLISILSQVGCDIVLLQYQGDQSYLKVDPNSQYSDVLNISGMKAFPTTFSLKSLREAMLRDVNNERLYGIRPTIKNCTNAWITEQGIGIIKQSVTTRGNDSHFFYNCFIRIKGVEDKLTYANELFQLQLEIKNAQRKFVVVNEEIGKPTPAEIAQIERTNYVKTDQLILDMARNIKYTTNIELQRLVHQAFVEVMLQEQKKESNLNKLTNKAVYLLSWMKRYLSILFVNWRPPELGCFIYLGGCKNDKEAMFLRFLAKLPIDVVILCPDLSVPCCLEDKQLYEIHFSESMAISIYPEEQSQVKIGTVAFHAERELDTLMYQDSGIFRNEQYGKANIICLQTMYEEIKLLWNQELKYRPNFSVMGDSVNIPVIFSKVSGVKDGAVVRYWDGIKELITEDTLVIKKAPYIESTTPNPMKVFTSEFYRNGRLQKNKIKNHMKYPYGILKEHMQDFMLEKLELMIEGKLIKGIGENGTEYLVIAQILNLPTEIVRMIQKFDFTKKNPKLIYINTAETIISIEDTIVTTFLNLIGFDVVFFIPTGYQNVERFFKRKLMEEHQIGEYKYDMQVPDFNGFSLNYRSALRGKNIFKRGN